MPIVLPRGSAGLADIKNGYKIIETLIEISVFLCRQFVLPISQPRG